MLDRLPRPGFLERLRMSINFFRWGTKRFVKADSKVPYIWPAWRINQPQWKLIDYQSYVQEGFAENAIVYSALMYKYNAIGSTPLRAYKGTFDEPEILEANHPLQKLCMRPNRWVSGRTFQGLLDVFLNISGNAFVLLDRPRGETMPQAMHLLRPDRTYIIPVPDKKELLGYYYVPEGKAIMDGTPYLPEQVIHFKMPNPNDPLDGLGEGLASLSPAARSADVDNMITKFLNLFFVNGAMPPGVLSFDVPLQPEDASQAQEVFMDIYGGYENWAKKVAVLDQGGKYQRVGLTFSELDMAKLDARNESRITGPFGVPLTLIESRPELVSSTYDNKATDRKMFWEDRMLGEIEGIQDEYQYHLQDDSGAFVMFDISNVPALSMSRVDKGKQAAEAFARGGITRNEYRAIIDQDPADDGDVYLIPANSFEQPIRKSVEEVVPPAATPAPKEEETQEGMPEATEEAEEAGLKIAFVSPLEFLGLAEHKASSLTPEQKATFWLKFDQVAQHYEPAFGDAANEAFEENRRRILAILNEHKIKSRKQKASFDFAGALNAIVNYLKGDSITIWANAFDGTLTRLVTDNVQTLNAQFGFETEPDTILAQNWFDDYKLIFAQPINDTTSEVINGLLQQAVTDGWSIDLTAKRIDALFDYWMTGDLPEDEFEWMADRKPFYRREMIARTETMRATNASSNALYSEWGVQEKEWLSTMDNRVRDTHADANGQVVKINQSFVVGGEQLRYPGDPMGSPGNTINCRCTELPVI